LSLIEALSNIPAGRKHARSVIDDWADTLSEAEREAVYAAARNHGWAHTALRDVLCGAGAPDVSANAVRDWRLKNGWRRDA